MGQWGTGSLRGLATWRKVAFVLCAALHLRAIDAIVCAVIRGLHIRARSVFTAPETLARCGLLLPPLVEARDVEELALVVLPLRVVDGLVALAALLSARFAAELSGGRRLVRHHLDHNQDKDS